MLQRDWWKWVCLHSNNETFIHGCTASMRLNNTICTHRKSSDVYLVIDEQLYWVISPFDQHNLIGLPWYAVGEWGANAGVGSRFQPHAHGESVHLRQALLDAAIQVVGSQGEGHLETLWGLKRAASCRPDEEGQRHMLASICQRTNAWLYVIYSNIFQYLRTLLKRKYFIFVFSYLMICTQMNFRQRFVSKNTGDFSHFKIYT